MPKRNHASSGSAAALNSGPNSDVPAALDVSDNLEISEEESGESSDEEATGTGLTGLDAIIASLRHAQHPAQPSEDDANENEAPAAASDEGTPSENQDEDPPSSTEDADPSGTDGQGAGRGEAGDVGLESGGGEGMRLPVSSLLRDEAFLADAGSDSSEDERPDRNTVGNVPLEWYHEEEHIGYDREGQALAKKKRGKDMLDAVLARNDNPGLALRTLYDPYNDEEMTLSREELRMLMNIQKGRMPDVGIDPHEDLVDWYSNEVDPFPIDNAPEPKRRFMPSKWEERKVVKLVRAIRRGWLKARKADDDEAASPPVYMMWDDNSHGETARTQAGLTYIPPPKPELPGHEESYNPPAEYLPTEAEAKALVDAAEQDECTAWLPQSFECLRHVPQYEHIVHERFERCLDLYLCPRVRSKRINYKPEDLVPKSLPKPADLRPFPNSLCITYDGHRSKVRSISPDPSGQWVLTGSEDGSVRLWEVLTGRCEREWSMGGKVHRVAWCPDPALRLVSCIAGTKMYLLPSGVGGAAVASAAEEACVPPVSEAAKEGLTRWLPREGGGMEIEHNHVLRNVTWHSRGDYFATVAPSGATQSVVVHQLSRKTSQNPFRKNRGRITCTAFHPTKPFFLVATENNVRVYNLAKQTLVKKLLAGGGVVTSMAMHSSGDHLLLGTEDRRCLWFDLDLSTKPYRVMRYHEAAVRGVAFHKSYPLFASGSDDGSVQVFHGMVYQDLMTNPLVVPVKILTGHTVHDYSGVLDVAFHPHQPWIFTAGGDGKACLFIDV